MQIMRFFFSILT